MNTSKSAPKKLFTLNSSHTIGGVDRVTKSLLPEEWVPENTSMLIIHGIGNQNPLETLDGFARGLIGTYFERSQHPKEDFTITHMVAGKPDTRGGKWYDNFLRLTKKGESTYIDLYEYYWANQTENKVSMRSIQSWVTDVVRQANKFYEENMKIASDGKQSGNTPIELNKNKGMNLLSRKDGSGKVSFSGLKYRFVLFAISLALPIFNWLLGFPRWLAKKSAPFTLGLSVLAEKFCSSLEDTISTNMANVIGDIVVYNTADAKSSLYEVRKNILAGAVGAVRYLIEPQPNSPRLYGRVVLAGHSLGTQIAYDAINRINHLISFGEIAGVDRDGNLTLVAGDPEGTEKRIDDLLCGLVTFGSPLDKIAFFLRDHVDRENIIMLQMIRDYHCFRQRDWYNLDGGTPIEFPVQNTLKKYFEHIPWLNYFDKRDYVSDPLDFYNHVENIDCNYSQFPVTIEKPDKTKVLKSRWYSFTHSWYWNNDKMYEDIIGKFLGKTVQKIKMGE